MSRLRNALGARDAHITTLRAIIAILVVACAAMWYGWQSAPRDLTIHNPPDLRSGSTRKWWEVPPSSVYAFTLYVWQQINRWPNNGEEDYKRNLYAYSPFLTDSCRAELEEDYRYRNQRNELEQRERMMFEIPGRGFSTKSSGPGSVQLVTRDQWIVNLDLAINETYAGTPIRDVYMRFPIRVVRADGDPQNNPWGLQIDCLAHPAERLEIPQLEGES
ncbi:TIGR03746 family integrating conjugative element protein [Halomonas sp. McH1-25]|uniref:PFL_4703 family integrating conjugative element protein n=1 Tax=unclassified Halomonas TaxID=2609666 RepID=UPI001EF5D41C|nr:MULTISPECIES: TIGR03746 family integrating conjugative element protein [unclassified Halomonas]MCG7601782.1 TIGR03746 family integrating conjugative element protein [Halomonas sp. McH1-25]MCP1343958.1 TIGR03746 family integrating conjugative element protein [Halomonas sp. FL8]MCP1361809.1 TIGR03746 family integrating conjugative element protein [Halomonas sp. BBD45]MCP1366568.1 TIGR03746 family integrating conjugative element protein [Halomonas sp. BBD48]